jgi:hypothetical protein
MRCTYIACPLCLAQIPVDLTRTRRSPGKTTLAFTEKSWADLQRHLRSHEEQKYKAAE